MQLLDDLVKYEVAEGEIRVTPLTDAQRNRAAWGMQRTNVQNLVTGVTEGFTKVLEITGVGYRAAAQGKNLRLQLGYSHDVNYPGSGGHRRQDSRPEHGRDQRHRQAEGRPGRGRDPPLAQAGALQGQGHQVSRRVYLPQRRQEEVSHGETLSLRSPPPPRAHRASRACIGQAAAFGPPFGPPHLCAGHRRRRGQDARFGLDPGQGSQGQDRRDQGRRCSRRQGACRARQEGRRVDASCSTVAASCSMAG